MRENDDIYEFWNKLPGPGEFSSDVFAAIPMAAAVWEGGKAEERQCEGANQITEYGVQSTEKTTKGTSWLEYGV